MTEIEEAIKIARELGREEGCRIGYRSGFIDGEVSEERRQERIRMLNDPARQKEMAIIKAEEEKKRC